MSSASRAVRVRDLALHLLPVTMRMPLKFGNQVVTCATCARVRVTVEAADGTVAEGWGETPLSVSWVWPAPLSYEERLAAMEAFCVRIGRELRSFPVTGHALEIGHAFIEDRLHALQEAFNRDRPESARLPHLAALVCFSAFDLAVHDAYGIAHGVPVYATYGADFLGPDLGSFLEPVAGSGVSFAGRRPAEFLVAPPRTLAVWHLVGGLDPLEPEDLTGDEPDDGEPVLLRDWIRRDGLTCLKIKLRGNDAAWDFERLVRIGKIGREEGVVWLTADFNCAVTEPAYVNDILDRLRDDDPLTHQAILYVEQPFPYDLEAHRIDVRSVSARKPLFMDESAHDWRFVRLGRDLGWSGVALKTCKTQTGALLSLCWAKAHGMTLMVQDLTNPMLALLPHVELAAHAGTIMGVESNGSQFYPEASRPEEAVHPGLYRRRHGVLDRSTVSGPGFGYRLGEIRRTLPDPVDLG
jgi:L-alanine-DL-glutamate epimerase-like enolase superfamily enzyme